MSGVLGEIDRLYEGCVVEPRRWPDQALADWSDAVVAGGDVDRTQARYIRRALNAARKLRAFWLDDSRSQPDDWRSGVDLALGTRAWRPQLDLAEHILARSGSPSAFDKVVELFPVVMNEPYMDGISYEVWLDRRDEADDRM